MLTKTLLAGAARLILPTAAALSLSGAMAMADDDVIAAGETLFASKCAACHGAEGQGAVGPALAGNENFADAAFVPQVLMQGKNMMPSFASSLDDEQAAQVASFVRNAWGNEFGLVTPEEIAAAR